jgi:hypothetical protein
MGSLVARSANVFCGGRKFVIVMFVLSNFELLHRLLMAKLALKLAADSAGADVSRSQWHAPSDCLIEG